MKWQKAQQEIPQPIVRQTTPKQQSTATILINTDAAWKEDTKTAGLAWIFYDNTGKQLQQGSTTEEWVSSPLTVEALAIREALFQAKSQGYNIELRYDAQVLIQVINGRDHLKGLFGIL